MISIDGNIGTGKSTVISNCLTQIPSLKVFLEPVDEWKEMIEKCTVNPCAWAYKLQEAVLEHFKKVKDEINSDKNRKTKGIKIILVERSALTSVNVFAKLYLQQQIITKTQYDQLYAIAKAAKIKYDERIFINTPPELCQQRVITRNRVCDRNSSLQYLKSIDELYKQMYDMDDDECTDDEKSKDDNQIHNKLKQKIKKKLPHVVINGKPNAESVFAQVMDIIIKLKKPMLNKNCLPSTQPTLKTFFKSEKDT